MESLTDHQRAILQEYQVSVDKTTEAACVYADNILKKSRNYSQNIASSIRTLQANNWDVEVRRLCKLLDEAHHVLTHSALSLLSKTRTKTQSHPHPLHRCWATQAQHQQECQTSAFSCGYSCGLSVCFTTTARLLYRPSISAPRRDARSEADRFLRDFESTYGTTHPVFFSEGGYTQALRAARKEFKYMLVVLCSEEHDDNARFCKDVLTDMDLLDFLHHHQVIVWGGNVRYTEAYQVSSTLQATTYPFLAIIALQQTNGTSKMAVLDRIEGPVPASSVIRRFEAVIARAGPLLDRLRMELLQRANERRLRQQQDQAYRDSLAADQRKQELLEEKKKAALKAKQARQELARKRRQYIQYLCQRELKQPNPAAAADADADAKITKISFRLSNGDRVIHQFRGDDTLVSLYEYIEVYSHMDIMGHGNESISPPEDYIHQYRFTMHSTFPRMVYLPDPSKKISDEKGLWPSATLIVDTNENNQEQQEEEEDSDQEA
ncbi:hypothetical protein [Parasitella parasitica]|uniref:UBX domain-containing protein n=1 Tax=Parasitella parasitica TaxID=35722 RepID=A0A0B7NNU6_9FUNG|nr:hypothetical protein [Parasitella parasitica]